MFRRARSRLTHHAHLTPPSPLARVSPLQRVERGETKRAPFSTAIRWRAGNGWSKIRDRRLQGSRNERHRPASGFAPSHVSAAAALRHGGGNEQQSTSLAAQEVCEGVRPEPGVRRANTGGIEPRIFHR